MKIINKLITLVLLSSTLASCATIMHGTRQSIGVSSNPTDAWIYVDRNYVGNTPLVLELSRSENHIVRIELPGYMAYEVQLTKSVSGWVFGNIVIGGLIGLAVDAVSGGIYKLSPDQVHAEMRSQYGIDSKNSNESFIAVVLEPRADWEKIGNLTPN